MYLLQPVLTRAAVGVPILAFWLTLAGLVAAAALAPAAEADEAQTPPFAWHYGPAKVPIGDIAEIQVPEGYQFTGVEGTRMLLQLMQNPVAGNELGLLMPSADEASWFVVFEFDDVGYVKDDEGDQLDAAAMLDSIRKGNEQGNRERERRGWAMLDIVGWEQPPRYDSQTHNLEWAVRATSQGDPIVNYNTRMLGRTGVMKANLVLDPQDLPAVLPEFRSLLAGYAFQSGNRYSEFRQGDKVAQYGLTALVTGGAAAVALKAGIFKKLWKVILLGILALGAFLKKLFGGQQSEQAA